NLIPADLKTTAFDCCLRAVDVWKNSYRQGHGDRTLLSVLRWASDREPVLPRNGFGYITAARVADAAVAEFRFPVVSDTSIFYPLQSCESHSVCPPFVPSSIVTSLAARFSGFH